MDVTIYRFVLSSDRGDRAAAIHYTLIQSAKRHGLDPFADARDSLLRIATEPNIDRRQLHPGRWKAALLSRDPFLAQRERTAFHQTLTMLLHNCGRDFANKRTDP